jgi:hypothetical protein
MCDMYAVPINFTVDKDQKKITNTFGGIVTIIFVLATAFYMTHSLTRMYDMDRTTFIVSSNWYEGSPENPFNLANYPDSFNMILGTKNTSIDWFDNPYISA